MSSKYYKKYYALNKEKIYKRNLEWRRKNKAWIKSYNDEWIKNNSEKRRLTYLKHNKKRYAESRRLVLDHYGRSCACCGESNKEFLSIDHINGGGKKHVKSIKMYLSLWLVKNNFPKGFRILCHNCNQAKGFYGYCPHRNLKEDVIEKGI